MEINPKIFKAYDIRGVYPQDINEKIAHNIGRALVVLLNVRKKIFKPKIVVGWDVRFSSLKLSKALIKGLRDQGAEVFDMGFCTTPMNYFANWFFKFDASVMITASHNPKEYNGFKIALKKVQTLPLDKDNSFFEQTAVRGVFKETKRAGSVKKINLELDYIDFLKKQVRGINFSGIKIVVDAANGCVGPIFKKVADYLGLNYILLYGEPDGSFPNHPPNPLEKSSLIDIKEKIIKERANIGIAFDGDADRVVFLDQTGQEIRSDFILGVYAIHFLKNKKPKYVPVDFRVSRGVVERIEKGGGKVIKCKVGYPYIYKAMKEYGAHVGGELSGHIHWKDFCYSSAGILSALRLIRILAEEKRGLKELVASMDTYASSSEINFLVLDRNKKIEEIAKIFSNGEQNRLDGLTVEYKDWWFNVRPSNTESLLRLTVEANSHKLLNQKIKKLSNLIEGDKRF